MAVLKDGSVVEDDRLDRLPEFDPKSREFPACECKLAGYALKERSPRSYTWRLTRWLDQGREGRCVEFTICHDLLARPAEVVDPVIDDILAKKVIYWAAQRNDQWPGGSYPGATPRYEGTSVLSGIKVAADLGLYGEYRWAFTLEEAVLALGYVGPLILGVNWYQGMAEPGKGGFIQPTGTRNGGHAILANAVKVAWRQKGGLRVWENVDLDRSYLTLHNSWGRGWGVDGECKITLKDFDRLRQEDGEVCIVTERLTPKALR